LPLKFVIQGAPKELPHPKIVKVFFNLMYQINQKSYSR